MQKDQSSLCALRDLGVKRSWFSTHSVISRVCLMRLQFYLKRSRVNDSLAPVSLSEKIEAARHNSEMGWNRRPGRGYGCVA